MAQGGALLSLLPLLVAQTNWSFHHPLCSHSREAEKDSFSEWYSCTLPIVLGAVTTPVANVILWVQGGKGIKLLLFCRQLTTHHIYTKSRTEDNKQW